MEQTIEKAPALTEAKDLKISIRNYRGKDIKIFVHLDKTGLNG